MTGQDVNLANVCSVYSHHEGQGEAVEGAGRSIIHAMSSSPQLDKAHQGTKAAVNVCQVAQHCGLEPGCPTGHADITVQTCMHPAASSRVLMTCRLQLRLANLISQSRAGFPMQHLVVC